MIFFGKCLKIFCWLSKFQKIYFIFLWLKFHSVLVSPTTKYHSILLSPTIQFHLIFISYHWQLPINILWRSEVKQEPAESYHSPKWETLGRPPQTEEHYFTGYCTVLTVHCILFSPIFLHNFPHNISTEFSC